MESRDSLGAVPELSVVVPVYFNAESLEELHGRIRDALIGAGVSNWDLTFVDDGSADKSSEVIESLRMRHPGIRSIRMSRNFGSIAAVQAGMAVAPGRAVAVIAADLQDPPELLTEMVVRWRTGAEVVLATRDSRQDPWLSRLLSACFYKVFRVLVNSDMPPGGFDFFLLDRRAVRALVDHAEKNANLAASVLWIGFRRSILSYDRQERRHGRSRWTFWKKFKYMIDSLLSYSYVPLRLMSAAGLGGLAVALGYGGFIVVEKLRGDYDAPGWASLMVVTLLFNGLVLLSVGIVGEYVWRTLDAARARPSYIVAECKEPPERGSEAGRE